MLGAPISGTNVQVEDSRNRKICSKVSIKIASVSKIVVGLAMA